MFTAVIFFFYDADKANTHFISLLQNGKKKTKNPVSHFLTQL